MNYFSKFVLLSLLVKLSLASLSFAQNADITEQDTDRVGQLTISTFVDSFYVVINNDFDNLLYVANHDTITVKAGEQNIRLIQKNYRDAVRTFDVRPDTLNSFRASLMAFTDFERDKYFSSYPRIAWEAPVLVQSDDDAAIYVNGVYAGTGLTKVHFAGKLTVESELPTGQSVRQVYNIDPDEQTFKVLELYNRPDRERSKKLGYFPGATRFYQGNTIRGGLLLGAFVFGTGMAVKNHINYLNSYDDFKKTRKTYFSYLGPASGTGSRKFLVYYGDIADRQLKDANRSADLRNAFIYGAIGVYLINYLDARREPRRGYRHRFSINPYFDFEDNIGEFRGINATLHFN